MYTAHPHDMVHIHAKFRENTSMRFWVTVQKLNVTDRQTDGRTDGRTDGGHCNISRPGPSAPREIKKEVNRTTLREVMRFTRQFFFKSLRKLTIFLFLKRNLTLGKYCKKNKKIPTYIYFFGLMGGISTHLLLRVQSCVGGHCCLTHQAESDDHSPSPRCEASRWRTRWSSLEAWCVRQQWPSTQD